MPIITLSESAWAEARKSSIGATDISAILGLNEWSSPLDVWMEKMGMSDVVENEAMRWGKYLEGPIAKRYSEITGFRLRKVNGIFQHKDHVNFHCTPDRLVLKVKPTRGLEIKTAGFRQMHDWGGDSTDNVPAQYLIQCQWSMFVTDRKIWDLAALIAGQDYRCYTFIRDDELIAMMKERAEKFWADHILTGDPPPATNEESRKKFLDKMFPEAAKPMKAATPEIIELAFRYDAVRAQLKELEAEKKKLKNDAVQFIGDAQGTEGTWGHVTYTQTAGKPNTEWRPLVLKLGGTQADIDEFTTRKPGRMLNVKIIKEDKDE